MSDALDDLLAVSVQVARLKAASLVIAQSITRGDELLATMLSARRVPVEQAKAPGREISRNTWVFEGDDDKVHPHYFCNARDLLALFQGFEVLALRDQVHDTPGSWHWHLLAERT